MRYFVETRKFALDQNIFNYAGALVVDRRRNIIESGRLTKDQGDIL